MTDHNPLVSVIVPIYGVEDYLEACVRSIIGQSYRNLEIILVDDGSRDNSPAICDGFMEADHRIKVIHKENGGLVSARKAGVDACTGQYIQFVDGDDWIEAEMIEILVREAAESQADMVMCNYYEVREHVVRHKLLIQDGIYEGERLRSQVNVCSLFGGRCNPHFEFGIEPVVWNKLFKKDLLRCFEKRIPEEISYGEDVACTMPLLLSCSSVAVIDQCLYYYRIHEKSMSKAYNSRQTMGTIKLIAYLKDAFGKNDDLIRQLSYYHVSITMANFCNECRGGMNRTAIARYRKLKKYLVDTDLKQSLRGIELKRFSTPNRILLLLLKSNMSFIMYLMLFFAVSRGRV
jgi:glycosyltransferase involved in cell wall biosynthesis